MRRPIGIVRIRLVERGHIVWTHEGRNLFVNAGRPALAALLGGDTAGEFAAAVGFGSGSNAPTVTDTALAVGYDSTSAFCQAFRRQFGYSPSRHRATARTKSQAAEAIPSSPATAPKA